MSMQNPTAPRFKCSGHGPAIEVECSFSTDDETEAWRHFEQTSHAVDEICSTCSEPCNYHATDMSGEPVHALVFQGPAYEWAQFEPRVDLNSRESIMRWLTWNSRGNGIVTDAESDAEDMPRLTLETAREALIESYYQSTGERITLLL